MVKKCLFFSKKQILEKKKLSKVCFFDNNNTLENRGFKRLLGSFLSIRTQHCKRLLTENSSFQRNAKFSQEYALIFLIQFCFSMFAVMPVLKCFLEFFRFHRFFRKVKKAFLDITLVVGSFVSLFFVMMFFILLVFLFWFGFWKV